MQKAFLTTHEAATELAVRRTTILGLIHAGQLKAVDVSIDHNSKRPSYRIPREALDELLEARTERPKQAKPAQPVKRVRKSPARFYA